MKPRQPAIRQALFLRLGAGFGPSVLQTAPALTGGWTDLPDAASPHTLTPAGEDAAFFGLRVP